MRVGARVGESVGARVDRSWRWVGESVGKG